GRTRTSEIEKRNGRPVMRIAHRVAVAGCLALAGCVWKSDYDALEAQNRQLVTQRQQQHQQISQLTQQNAALGADNDRLTGSIKYTINSGLLFRSGSWEMTPQGQEVIAE